jgi:hypothetical protein
MLHLENRGKFGLLHTASEELRAFPSRADSLQIPSLPENDANASLEFTREMIKIMWHCRECG